MGFSRTRSRDSSSGAWRATRSSNVAFGSSIIAHSSPFISTPCCSKSFGSTRRGGLAAPPSRTPEGVGQPFRRIDRQHADLHSAFGQPGRDRRRGGRLADPAGARADDDLLALEGVGEAGALGAPPRPFGRRRAPAGAAAGEALLARGGVGGAGPLGAHPSLFESSRAASGPRSGSNRKGRVL